jgi:hypothetical protein
MEFPEVVEHLVRTGQGFHGDVIYANPVNLNVRWQDSSRLLHLENGETKQAQAKVFSESSVKVGDKLKRNGTEYIVFSGGDVQDGFGEFHHSEVYL